MKLIVLDEYTDACEWAAKYIKKRINTFNPNSEKNFVLGLPTGKYLKNACIFFVNILNSGYIYFKVVHH